MRIRPKNPKVQKTRRIVVGVLAVAVVLAVLLHSRPGDGLVEDESAPLPETATTAVPEGIAGVGEIDWEYPPGWIDYSDLPAEDELGDDDRRGLGNWRYLLVNGLSQENYLRDSYYPDMTFVEDGFSFQTRAVADLKAFIAAAREAGYAVTIRRTYLSYGDQRVRFNGMASTIYDRGEVTLEEAEKQVIAMGYYPGADEHQTGLAVNFADENGEAKFSTPVLEWMREHCAEYGFILRYPEGREAYTGREAEPGHFRYVGDVAAEFIMRKGITLEEFKAAYEEGSNPVVAW